MKTVRAAIVGCGNIASEVHVPNSFAIPRLELKALCDTDDQKAKMLGEKYGIAQSDVYSNIDGICSRDDIDALIICTPVKSHHGIALKGAESGKHVFVEKPIASTLNEAEKMVSVFKEANLKLAVGHYLEFMPQHVYLKNSVRKGRIGKVINITVHDEILRIYPEEGIILDLATHYIDLIRWYFDDSRIERVSAWSGNYEKGEGYKETVAEIKIYFENGVIGNVNTYWLPGFKNRDGCSKYLKILGTKGKYKAGLTSATIEAFLTNNFINKLRGPFEFVPHFVSHPEIPISATSYRKELEDFADSILDDKEPAVSGFHTLDVMKVVEGAYKSNAENRVIKIGDL